MEWSFEHGGVVDAVVEVPAGSVEVGSSTDGRVVVVLEALSHGAGGLVEAAEVTLTTDDKLRVHVPSRLVGRGEVRCEVTLPEGSALSFRTASADLHCTVVLADFDGKTASGDLRLTAVSGRASVSSASGDFSCEEVGGRLLAKSASGAVEVRRVASAAQVSTASGDLDIGELGGLLKASSASGDMRVGCAGRGRLTCNTASGDVSIGVAPGVGAYLDVTSVTGEMECSLPFQEERPGTAELEIVCRTVSGDVRILAATG